ncbi:hypothetical protein [Microbulbifer elongatus]|uniref:hypothetical protein n=1 Tax=Microbulbifer elongatus TaxID=86173 RepID=UPI001CFD14CF|nr:hypothetical protein [Microbulbifer elongatus]
MGAQSVAPTQATYLESRKGVRSGKKFRGYQKISTSKSGGKRKLILAKKNAGQSPAPNANIYRKLKEEMSQYSSS